MSIQAKVAQALPDRRKQQIRYAMWGAVDLFDRVSGRRDEDLPPKRLRDWIGNGDFRAIGDEMVGYATDLGGLKPTDRVLDIGSGMGRVAISLTSFLKDGGAYDGVEIVPRGVKWCRENITPKHPNFRFHHADIHNITYNPNGKLSGESYAFPFEDETFDFIILTSVFTHLLPATVERYVAEIGRLLKPGGRVMGTWFLLNTESETPLDAGRSNLSLRHTYQGARVENASAPEDAIAFPEPYVRDLFAKASTPVHEPIHYGSWSGRPGGVSFQDILVAEKSAT